VCLACAPLDAEGRRDFAESFDADGLAVGPALPRLRGVDAPLDATNPVSARYRIGVAVAQILAEPVRSADAWPGR
jgi:hypothetical protein